VATVECGCEPPKQEKERRTKARKVNKRSILKPHKVSSKERNANAIILNANKFRMIIKKK